MSEAAPSSAHTLSPHHLRLFALIIDYLLLIVVLNLGQQVGLGPHWDLRPVPGFWTGLWPRLVTGAVLVLAKDAVFGVSPGKWFTGIAIRRVDDPERPPARAALVLRNVALVLLPVEALLVFLDPYCRRLGDRIAGTIVVLLPDPTPLWRRMLVFSSLVLASMLAGFLVAPWNMHRSAAYQAAARIVPADPLVQKRAGPDAVMDTRPAFNLELGPEESHATLSFEAEGSAGTAHGTLTLRLEGPPPHWVKESLKLTEPTLLPSEAPFGEKPGGEAPPGEEAPKR